MRAVEYEHRGAQRRTEEPLGQMSHSIIASAMKVHSGLGPGLLESVYETCLCHELSKSGLSFQRQVAIPVRHDGRWLECGFRADLIVENSVIVEIKAVDGLKSIHDSQ